MKHRSKPWRFSLGVVLLAAGRSRRMGQPKMLLPWQGTTVLGHLAAQWRGLGATQVAVVFARDDQVLQQELDRLGVPHSHRIENPSPDLGMFSSIQAAARWRGWEDHLTHWAFVLGDQPHLKSQTLRALLEFGAKHPDSVCQPARADKPRHPVLLPKSVFLELAQAATENLRAFLQNREVALCELDDAGLDLDLDEPKDYAAALALVRSETPSPHLHLDDNHGA